MKASDFSADYEAVVRGDMTADEFVARRTTEELRAFPRVSSIQAQVEHSRLADADRRRRTLALAMDRRATQPKRKPPRDPVTRYMLGQIDTIEFLTEYDRPEVPPGPYVDDSEALRRAQLIERMNDAALMA